MFMIMVLYFVISTPLESMFGSFDDADSGDATDEMNTFLPNIRNAMNMAFAIAIVTPPVVFILWIFYREPEWTYRRRRH